jgi:hypothetical protein
MIQPTMAALAKQKSVAERSRSRHDTADQTVVSHVHAAQTQFGWLALVPLAVLLQPPALCCLYRAYSVFSRASTLVEYRVDW